MEARQRRRTERIGRLEQDTFRSGAKLASHRKKVLKGWFSFTPSPPNTRTRPNNFSILLSSRYPVISHHLYDIFENPPVIRASSLRLVENVPYFLPISLHVFSFQNVLSLSTFLSSLQSGRRIYFPFQLWEMGKKQFRRSSSIILTFVSCYRETLFTYFLWQSCEFKRLKNIYIYKT